MTHPRRVIFTVALVVILSGPVTRASAETISTVAVFPIENLSGHGVATDGVRQVLIDRLGAAGIRVLDLESLDRFMARHRVRYAAGVDAATAEALRKEAGVDGVVIASVELSNDVVPPKVAWIVRLVSIQAEPAVVWADDAGLAGDDAPGFFELGMVNDYETLQSRALDRLTDSLLAYLKNGRAVRGPKSASKFRPKTFYGGVALKQDRPYSVVVLPFFNRSARRNAGDILALLFMRHLSSLAQFRVVDSGVARRQLLDARIIMDAGLSISDADTVAALLDADFVLGGQVLRYEDYEGPGAKPRVEFSTVLIERKSRRVIWSSGSYNEGTDGVRFFERGTSRTAHTMATQMVRLTAQMMAGRER